jgi:hypothetical protein
MVEAVKAQNELLCSEDPIIVSQVQTALQEYGEPAYRADCEFHLVGEPVAKGTNTIDSTRGVKITGAKESVETSLDDAQLRAKDTADSGLKLGQGTTPVEAEKDEGILRVEHTIDSTCGIKITGAKESVESSLDEGQLGAKETADSGLKVGEGTASVGEGNSEVTLRGEDTTSGDDSTGNVEGARATNGQTDAEVTPS